MAALDLTDLAIDGRRLVVNEAYQSERGRRESPRSVRTAAEVVSERLYVGNLAEAATEQAIRQLFTDHGFRPWMSTSRSIGPLGFPRGLPSCHWHQWTKRSVQSGRYTAELWRAGPWSSAPAASRTA